VARELAPARLRSSRQPGNQVLSDIHLLWFWVCFAAQREQAPSPQKAIPSLFPKAHHFVTERPSVAQNPAQVTACSPSEKSPRKISSSSEPLFQALFSRFQIFLECPSNKLAA
jgi:hypothetical protein